MACKTSCKLCPHLVLSQSVTFANDTLTINIPAGSYAAGEKFRPIFRLFWFTTYFQNLMPNLFLFPCYNIIVKKIQKECKNNG